MFGDINCWTTALNSSPKFRKILPSFTDNTSTVQRFVFSGKQSHQKMAVPDTVNVPVCLTPSQEVEFRIYLDQSGVMQLIGNVLSYAYKEQSTSKPPNLFEMIKTKIVAASANPSSQKLEQLVEKVHQLHQEIDKTKEDNSKLRIQLGLAETDPMAPGSASGVSDGSSPSSPDGRTRGKAGATTDHHSKSISKPPGIKKKK